VIGKGKAGKQRLDGRLAPPRADVARPAADQAVEERDPVQTLQDTAGNHAVSTLLEGIASGHNLPAVDRAVRSPSRSLDHDTRAAMEARLGHDLADVRIHDGAQAAESAEALDAQAFTVGRDVVLGTSATQLGAEQGQRLLAHELAHVVQQRGARTATRQTATLEAQADRAADSRANGSGAAAMPAGAAGVQRKAKVEEEERKGGVGPQPEEKTGKEAGGQEKEGKPKPGALGSIWSGIKGAASTVWSGMKAAGKAIWGATKAVGGAVWEGMKTLGGWIAAGAEKVWAAAKWLGRQLWDKVTAVFARVTRWVTKLPERVGRLFAGLWEGLTSLKPWSLAWWKSLAKVDTWLDFLKWLGSRVVDLLEILGIGEAYETVMDLLKFNTRALTSQEIAEASKVFGTSINLGLVRLDEHAFIGPAFTDREYTSFHTINGWGDISPDTLIHELTHVWQYETAGAIYMPQAIHAQIQRGDDAYNYGGVPGLQRHKDAGQGLGSFNREEQAQIVQDFYRIKKGLPPIKGAGTPADLPLYAHFVKDASTLSPTQLLV